MELWIRSQDRKKLVKIEVGLYTDILQDFNSGGFSVYTNSTLTDVGLLRLGKYKTKERALEVLDEIQRILQPIIFIKDKQESFIGEDGNIYKMNVEGMKNSEIQELSTYVYEMPKE